MGGLSFGLVVAGLGSPYVGRAIAPSWRASGAGCERRPAGGGPCRLALAPALPVFFVGWIVSGVGMAVGLYDPAFATLGRLYGESTALAITLTLFGGFSSTVCWPLSAFLEAHLGWRGTCLTYAALQLGVSLPVYLWGLPREPSPRAEPRCRRRP